MGRAAITLGIGPHSILF